MKLATRLASAVTIVGLLGSSAGLLGGCAEPPVEQTQPTVEQAPSPKWSFMAVPTDAFWAGEVTLDGVPVVPATMDVHRVSTGGDPTAMLEALFADPPYLLAGLDEPGTDTASLPDAMPPTTAVPLVAVAAVPVGELVIQGVGFLLIATAGWFAVNQTQAYFEDAGSNDLDVGDQAEYLGYSGVGWAERGLEDLEDDAARDLTLDQFVAAVADGGLLDPDATQTEEEKEAIEALWTGVLFPSLARRIAETGSIAESDTDEANPCGDGAPHFDRPAGLLRAPYLQRMENDGAVVMWTVEGHASQGTVRLSDDDGHQGRDSGSGTFFPVTHTHAEQDFTQFAVEVDHLLPGHSYCYDVEVDGRVVASNLLLRTPEMRPLFQRGLVLGDSGTDDPLRQYPLAELVNLHDAELFLHVGDLAYDPDPRYGGPKPDKPGKPATYAFLDKTFFGAYESLLSRVPVYPALGNHEEYAKAAYAPHTDWFPAEPYLRSFTFPCTDGVACSPDNPEHGRYYSFERANLHVTVLDANPETIGGGIVPDDPERRARMLDWLERDLSSPKPWKIVMLHYPAWVNAKKTDGTVAVREHIVPILQRHGVDLVLAGDSHMYERTVPIYQSPGGDAYESAGGITYITAGSGGREVKGAEEPNWFTAKHNITHNAFVRFAILGCHLYGEAIGIKPGKTKVKVIDAFTINGCY